MQRHDLDPVSTVTGLFFVAIAVGYLVTHVTGSHLPWLTLVSVGLIAFGAVALGFAARRVCAPSEGDVQ